MAKASTVKETGKQGIINAPQEYLIGSYRLAPAAQEIKTGVTLDIPEGGVAVLRLSAKVVKMSKLRLVNTLVGPGEQVILHVDNLGIDFYRIMKGDALVEYFIIAG